MLHSDCIAEAIFIILKKDCLMQSFLCFFVLSVFLGFIDGEVEEFRSFPIHAEPNVIEHSVRGFEHHAEVGIFVEIFELIFVSGSCKLVPILPNSLLNGGDKSYVVPILSFLVVGVMPKEFVCVVIIPKLKPFVIFKTFETITGIIGDEILNMVYV